ncbi:adhesion G-protein coupled receptor G5-like isoform X12 [Trematomus bernacchii]|uniref:adhesion G-protein coupled receptor G5-like isoform X12 n=1 Tax=Trematomus bernacchii TaxID=40690 RepID=UPI00146C9289|nr:adhesion G-protein coupled receptor G5-like isoform X12 [Trematomus bernacchii]
MVQMRVPIQVQMRVPIKVPIKVQLRVPIQVQMRVPIRVQMRVPIQVQMRVPIKVQLRVPIKVQLRVPIKVPIQVQMRVPIKVQMRVPIKVQLRVPIQVQMRVQMRVPIQVQMRVPIMVPIKVQLRVPIKVQLRVPIKVQLRVPIKVPIQVQIRVPIKVQMRVPIQAQMRVPIKVPIQVQMRVPIQVQMRVPIKVPIQVQMRVPIKVQLRVPIQVQMRVPIKVQLRVPIKVQLRVPIKVPIQVQMRVPIKVQMRVPIKVPIQVQMRVPIKVPIQVQMRVPIKVQLRVPIQVQMRVPIKVQLRVPIKVPIKVQLMVPIKVPIKVQLRVPIKVPIKVQLRVPIKVQLRVPIKVPIKVQLRVPIKVQLRVPIKVQLRVPIKVQLRVPIKVPIKFQLRVPIKVPIKVHFGVMNATLPKQYKDIQKPWKALWNTDTTATLSTIETLERLLEETEVNESISLSFNNSVAFLYKPKVPFNGLEIHASDKKVRSSNSVSDSDKVSVQLPRELDAGSENTIVFCMLTWPDANWTIREASAELHESRLVGLSVRGKNISGLQERVNITLAVSVNDTQKPSCVFLNVFTKDFSTDGCLTLWEPGQRNIICSCDHLTYFGVLVVSSASLSQNDLQILTYITLIGCSLSLFALIITVLLFIAKRKVRADISMKVHINLAIALILLNLHFLPSQTVAALSFPTLCFYMAVSLHYSLLATFSWMALEGLHLYLLLVRVFNIYIRKYLLKLSLVGWGLPAVIVALVVIIDSSWYGLVPLVSSNPNSTQICYIRNTTVKLVTTLGVFGLVFLFNAIMLGVTVRRVVSLHQSKKFGQSDSNRVKKDICTLLGVTALLGITWGLVFFSFGYLTTPGLYLFCILNSLQGFFIFLWFVMSLRKKGDPSTKSSVTRSTNT